MRWLELFAGIGGAAAAIGRFATVARAIDHDGDCHATYTANWPHPAHRWNLEFIRASALEGFDAWWMSPPCQPFTVRGARRDLADRRARSFVAVLRHLSALRPRVVAMENVPGFVGSEAHGLLRRTLAEAGYQAREVTLCPTALGVPMVRRRWYLVASRGPLPPVGPSPRRALRLADALDAEPDPALWAPAELVEQYGRNLPVVDADAPDAVALCFTGAYGVSPVYSGSWLRTPAGPRRFSTREILRLMGFPEDFTLRAAKEARGYRLVGNSVSVDAVAAVVGPLCGV